MLEILRNWFHAVFPEEDSARMAKERLRLVLIQDQAGISPGLMNVLRNEMVGVVSRYLEIDSAHLEMGLERRNETMALLANIPVVRIRKEGRLADGEDVSEFAEPAVSGSGVTGKKLEKRYRRAKRRYR